MRSIYYLLLLAAVMITAAFVTRSGILARKNPGRPINSAMREALDKQAPQLSIDDERLIQQQYGTAHKTTSGLRYVVRTPGNGNTSPSLGDEVIYHYALRLLDGTQIQSSYQRGVPLTKRLDSGGLIPGLEQGLRDMKKGEKRTLVVPHWIGYGDKGSPKLGIPPKATLIFEVELLDWR